MFCKCFSLNAQDEKTEKIYKVVEQMPRFYSEECENFTEQISEVKKCAYKALEDFIYKNIKLPNEAKALGIKGTVVVRFVVGKDGEIGKSEILRELGGGCEEELLRVVKMIPVFRPGVHKGEKVSVYFNLPVRFGVEKLSVGEFEDMSIDEDRPIKN